LSIVFCTYPADYATLLDESGYIHSQSPYYSGIKFPDGTTQATAIDGSGLSNKLAYWSDPNSLTYNNNLTWSNNGLLVNGSGSFTSLFVSNNLSVSGTITGSGYINNSYISNSTFNNNIFYRNSDGCFFHAYVDNLYDNMVALHSTNEQEPTWKLGIKPYSSSFTAAPTVGYISGKNGSVGIYSTDQNGLILNFTNGFWVKHRNIDILNADRNNGVAIYNSIAAKDALRVIGAAAQSANLQTWETYTSSIVASMSIAGQLTCQSVKFPNNTQTKAYIETFRNVNSNTLISSSDDVILADCSVSNTTLTLPSAINIGGKKIAIKRKTGGFNLILSTQLSQTIDGQNSLSINTNYQFITVVSDNANWFII